MRVASSLPLASIVMVASIASIASIAACSSSSEGSGPGQGCSLVGCVDGATYSAPLGIALDASTITACRDDQCATGPFGAPLTLPDGTITSVTSAGGTLLVQWILLDGAPVADGDTYYARFDDAKSGATLYTIDSGPVHYTTSQPNGPGCAPTCHAADIPASAGKAP